jgi:acyl-CoA thioesterase II
VADPRSLTDAILESFEGLLLALNLEAIGTDRFRVRVEPSRFDRVFGGQSLAQALVAAAATAEHRVPNSLHAYFVAAGRPDEGSEIHVARVRDGRSLATRRVSIVQGERVLLEALVSFSTNESEPTVTPPRPQFPEPDQVPLLQEWVNDDVPPELRSVAAIWVERPPPLDLRIGEPLNFIGGPSGSSPRSHWMRLPRAFEDDAVLHAALLAYASDYFLMDMAFRSHPQQYDAGFTGLSLDHAIWFHRPVQFDAWHLHTQETMAIVGHRALVRGSIHDLEGRLVASAIQEVLVRTASPATRSTSP